MSMRYTWEGKDITATAIAEAAERNVPLLSFQMDTFVDRELCVVMGDTEHI